LLKFGIDTIEQLHSELESPSNLWIRQVSIPLLLEVDRDDLPPAYRERILLELADDRGAYKRTYRNRFDIFDRELCDRLVGCEHTGGLKVLDCGVSDAGTAVDFFRSILDRNFEVDYLATDYDPQVMFAEIFGGRLTVTSSNDPLQLSFWRFVFSFTKPDSWIKLPLNRLIAEALLRTLVRRTLMRIELGETQITQVSLFGGDALSLSKTDNRFKLGQLDIRQDFPSTGYNVIRMMNVLNPKYFTPEEFDQIVRNVEFSIEEGGYFAFGSNEDAGTVVNGAILKRVGARWEQQFVSGSGPIPLLISKLKL